MKLAYLAVATAATCTLIACSPEPEKENATKNEQAQATLLCQDPAVLPNMRENLQKMVRDEALKIAGQNHASLIDVDKLVAAAASLEINLKNVQNQSSMCSGELSVGIPKRIMTLAKHNAPILNMDAPESIIQQRLKNGNAKWDNLTLTLPISYAVTKQNQQFAITYNDTSFSSISTTLATALQTYGVKDTLNINGKTISREQAIDLINNPQPIAPSVPEMAVQEVPTISPENNVPSSAPHAPIAQKNEPPQPNPQPAPQPENVIAPEKLAQTEQAHRNADRDIKQAWRKIDPSVQQTLVDEQRAWEGQKQQHCLKAAAKGSNHAESQYLHMQCDTRLTRERIKYLNGYSIPE